MEANILEIINKIRALKGENITYEEFAKALNITKAGISKRIERKSKVKHSDIEALKEYFQLNYEFNEKANTTIHSMYNLGYYENPKLTDLIRNPFIQSIPMPCDLIDNMWKKNPEYLRLIAMPGDKMAGKPTHHLYIRNRDILLMDTSSTNINRSGIYAYETLNGTKIQISNVSTMLNGNVRFYYANDAYEDEIRTPTELKALKFKVVGRILKNLSFIFD